MLVGARRPENCSLDLEHFRSLRPEKTANRWAQTRIMRFANLGTVALLGCAATPPPSDTAVPIGTPTGTPDTAGYGDTTFTAGNDPANAFFASLGTNERTCASCHDVHDGWSVTPASLAARFAASDGLDPVFRAIDGAGAPTADCTTLVSRRTAYALLLSHGLFRVARTLPAGVEFSLVAVDDPNGYASASELSLFRRPLPSTNLRFNAAIMWEDREPTLDQQAIDATLGHAEATGAPTELVPEIVAFESSIYTAQTFDTNAGDLALDAGGGPAALATQPYRRGATGTFTLFTAWQNDANAKRAQIAHGEDLFNTHRFQIRGVAGLSDRTVTCATCHDTPNAGSHSTPLPMNIGISDPSRRVAGLPLYTLKNLATGATIQTTDPGLALTTGKWADIGRFEVPNLRGAAMHPPYFHDGFAATLADVVELYDDRFDLHLDRGERADLAAFLAAL